MNNLFTERFWQKKHELVKKFTPKKIADWFLQRGYYPELYVLPPCFNSDSFTLKGGLSNGKNWRIVRTIGFPKGVWVDRIFGVIDPRIYHDIVFLLKNNWQTVIDYMFSERKIFSYSFPIPLDPKTPGKFPPKKAGRMIYEYIEMAEKDLAADMSSFDFIVQSDVKNCYPSIYSHSVVWAMHGKEKARACLQLKKVTSLTEVQKKLLKECDFGIQLDRLISDSNDGCTNGIPIGPATSDLISEIVLCAVDQELSKMLTNASVEFIGVRFKDDYRIACRSKADAKITIKKLGEALSKYNLALSDEKTKIAKFPDGLYRPWSLEYSPASLGHKNAITFKEFESTYFKALEIFRAHPGRGLERFLSDLMRDKSFALKLNFRDENKKRDAIRFANLIWALVGYQLKILPQVLGILEKLFEQKLLLEPDFQSLFQNVLRNSETSEYALCWVAYFAKSNKMLNLLGLMKKKSEYLFLASVLNNKNCLFDGEASSLPLFKPVNKRSMGGISAFVFPFYAQSKLDT